MKPKNPAGFRLGIVNPLTLVGNEVKTVLRERSFPLDKVTLLDSTGQAAGALTDIGDEPAVVAAVSDLELEDLDLVFFCGPPAGNHDWIERHREDRFLAIDLSQPSSVEDGALAVAGLNLDDIAGESLIVSPHPVAIPIALVLHQIETLGPIESCISTVIQPASEFEQEGVEELAQQTISVLNIQAVTHKTFDRQLAFNLYPAPVRNEDFVVRQLHKLIDTQTEIALMITQGAAFHSHTFSLFIRTREELDVHRIEGALRANTAIAFAEGDQEFGTIDAAGRDEVLIADVRPEPSIAGGFWVWAVCDNLRRSAALNAVLIAEKLLLADQTN